MILRPAQPAARREAPHGPGAWGETGCFTNVDRTVHLSHKAVKPDWGYPLRLSTGRDKFQFHTRTKKGRSKKLRGTCPDPEVRVSREDAAEMGLWTGDDVVVRLRHGAIELRVKVGGVSVNQVFVPFQFGYWDAKDGKTLGSHFQTGNVQVRRRTHRQDRGVREATVPRAVDERHSESWLGETYESVKQLSGIYSDLLLDLIHDVEIEGGIRVMRRIAGLRGEEASAGRSTSSARTSGAAAAELVLSSHDESRSDL
ncbi:hypothetical protein CTA2_7089 [Colletotrichum tanaceti]|nr:hypothetical protein CTA2_7089 [Colletotrichum tanaceti]